MKLIIIVEGRDIDLTPLADLMELATIEKERIMEAWLDIPLEMVPNRVATELRDSEIAVNEPLVAAIRGMGQTHPIHKSIVYYLSSKIHSFGMRLDHLVGVTITPTRIELILEV